MPLELYRFDVAVARDGLDPEKALEAGEGSGYDVHRVTVLHADQLVGEQAGPRYGIPKATDAPMAATTLWCWAALRRSGVEVPEFPLFKGRVLALSKVTSPNAAGDAVDPTTPVPDTG